MHPLGKLLCSPFIFSKFNFFYRITPILQFGRYPSVRMITHFYKYFECD